MPYNVRRCHSVRATLVTAQNSVMWMAWRGVLCCAWRVGVGVGQQRHIQHTTQHSTGMIYRCWPHALCSLFQHLKRTSSHNLSIRNSRLVVCFYRSNSVRTQVQSNTKCKRVSCWCFMVLWVSILILWFEAFVGSWSWTCDCVYNSHIPSIDSYYHAILDLARGTLEIYRFQVRFFHYFVTTTPVNALITVCLYLSPPRQPYKHTTMNHSSPPSSQYSSCSQSLVPTKVYLARLDLN